ncbi:MAG: hypothetical protein FWH21_03105 [Kiritimatiellaeota bacterium]|nr:hypothetical protein [Kiritimatiellota bacterium]
MKKLCVSLVFLGMLSSAVFGDELERLNQMHEVLQKNSIEGFFDTVRINRWNAPRIPSKWFIDAHVKDADERRLLQAARDFGYQLALRLDDLAQEQQVLPVGDALFQRTLVLCDLGDWCAETVGYGNTFLAYRCLDLVAVGLARLTASLEFPLASCEKIAVRMNPKWGDVPYQLQVLNGEANTNLFINDKITHNELIDQWSIGWTMREMAENPASLKELVERYGPSPPFNPRLVDVKAAAGNLRFFLSDDRLPNLVTLSEFWDSRWHRKVAMGLFTQARNKALSLLKFRAVVGFFPSPFVRSEEELKRRDAEIEKYAKRGITITKLEDGPSYDSLYEAFRREWEKNANKKAKEYNEKEYVNAYYAYKEVTSSTFFDEDTAQIQSKKQREEKEEQRQKK